MKPGGTTQKLTPKQSAILQYLKVHPLAGRGEIVKHISEITEDGVKYNLKQLQDMGLRSAWPIFAISRRKERKEENNREMSLPFSVLDIVRRYCILLCRY